MGKEGEGVRTPLSSCLLNTLLDRAIAFHLITFKCDWPQSAGLWEPRCPRRGFPATFITATIWIQMHLPLDFSPGEGQAEMFDLPAGIGFGSGCPASPDWTRVGTRICWLIHRKPTPKLMCGKAGGKCWHTSCVGTLCALSLVLSACVCALLSLSVAVWRAGGGGLEWEKLIWKNSGQNFAQEIPPFFRIRPGFFQANLEKNPISSSVSQKPSFDASPRFLECIFVIENLKMKECVFWLNFFGFGVHHFTIFWMLDLGFWILLDILENGFVIFFRSELLSSVLSRRPEFFLEFEDLAILKCQIGIFFSSRIFPGSCSRTGFPRVWLFCSLWFRRGIACSSCYWHFWCSGQNLFKPNQSGNWKTTK